MQAIKTKYFGPGNTTGSCIRAKCEAGSVRMPYNYALNVEGNHKAACDKLRKKLGWDTADYGDVVGGQFGDAYYWVFDEKRLQALKGVVNSVRECTWTGNPWAKPEFKAAVRCVGASYGFYGDALEAPTTDSEAAALKGN